MKKIKTDRKDQIKPDWIKRKPSTREIKWRTWSLAYPV
jgi:hypothetical protein